MEYVICRDKMFFGSRGGFARLTVLLLAMVVLLAGCEVTQRNGGSVRQVSFETLFIYVGENWLEDIGLALSRASLEYGFTGFDYKKIETELEPEVSYEFFVGGKPMEKGQAADLLEKMEIEVTNFIVPGYYDDLETDLLLRIIDDHSDSRRVTAPKITVLDGEPGKISMDRLVNYVSGYKEMSGLDWNNFEAVTHSFSKSIGFKVVPKVLKQSGNVEVAFESKIEDDILITQHKHESGKMYDVPQLQKSRVKGQFEIPKGKCLVIVGHKRFAATDSSKNKSEGIEKFLNKKNKPKVEVILIFVKPTVIEAVSH